MAAKGTTPDSAAWAAALKHRPAYSKPLGDYFATYKVKERGLKKWIEEARLDWITSGCKAGGPEFPPLDDPPKMLAWWMAHKKHAPSAELLALAGKAAATEPASPSTEQKGGADSSTTLPPPAAAKRIAIDVNAIEGVDLAGAARQQRRILAAALKEHAEALANPDTAESTVSLRAKRVDDAMERLRTIDAALIKQQRETGELVHRDRIRDDVAPLLSAMADSLVSEICESFGVARPLATAFADRWFGTLRNSRFFAPAVPSHAPTTAAA